MAGPPSAGAAGTAARRDRDLARFLSEDAADCDVTGMLVPNRKVGARVVSVGTAVVAGGAHAARVFEMRGCSARIGVEDGRTARPGGAVMSVRGPAREILACERTALNLLSRMSGIATATRRMVDALDGTGVEVLATRKTAPGLRAFDKEAVEIGGGGRHRMSLDDGVLIKDNHIAVDGSAGRLVRRAAAAAREAPGAGGRRRRRRAIEAEADTVEGAVEAAAAGADVVMLDNFAPRDARRAVAALEREGLRDRIRVEASGGITEETAARYAAAGVDCISVGALTHSVRAADYTLAVDP